MAHIRFTAAIALILASTIPLLVSADDEQLCTIRDPTLNKVILPQNLDPFTSMLMIPVIPDPMCIFYRCLNGSQVFLHCNKKLSTSATSFSSSSQPASSSTFSSSASQGSFQPPTPPQASTVNQLYSSVYNPEGRASGLISIPSSPGLLISLNAALNTYYLYGPKLPLSLKVSLCEANNAAVARSFFDLPGPTSNKMLFGLANTLFTSLSIECLNPIFITKNGLLEDMTSLKMLDIKFTQPSAMDFTSRNVMVLPNGAFAGAKSLESIRLDFVSAKVRLNSSVFDGLPNLRCLEMSGRNFDCSYCPLQDLLANSTFMRPDLNNGSYYVNPYLPGDNMSCGKFLGLFPHLPLTSRISELN